MNEKYQDIYKLIKEYNSIIIHRHSRPDGDALGAQLGLKDAILTTFPEKEVCAVGDESGRYSFIGKMDIVDDEKFTKSLVILLDSSDSSLLSDERFKNGLMKVKIDHHIFKEQYADIELIDTSFESCCGIIADFVFSMNMKLTEYGAKCIYTGLVTDSGRFRYDCTNSRTFFLASKLFEYGFDVNDVYNNLYIEDIDIVKLRAQFVMKFKVTQNNVAYIMTTKEELSELNVDVFTISRGMVNTMAGIKGIDIWSNFTEEKDGCIIVELRSNKYDISHIATKYGGGGHAKACGCTVKSFDEARLILEDLDNIICSKEG